jgi:hypothetical protein
MGDGKLLSKVLEEGKLRVEIPTLLIWHFRRVLLLVVFDL